MMTVSVHRSQQRAAQDYERLSQLKFEPNPIRFQACLEQLVVGSAVNWRPVPKHLSQREMRQIVQDALLSYDQPPADLAA